MWNFLIVLKVPEQYRFALLWIDLLLRLKLHLNNQYQRHTDGE
jgi:hypothetical protein